jgi:hypothetical protein
VLDDASAWSPNGSNARGITVDASGNVYASGYTYSRNATAWCIRRGNQNGGAWTTVYKAAKGNSDGGGIKYVPPAPGKHNGGIFAVGRLTPGSTTQWTVLRSQNAGATWAVVDSWTPAKNQAAAAKVIASDPQGNIYVAGFDGKVPSGWWVRRSGNGGATWQTVLTRYNNDLTIGGQPEDIAADAAGNVYVVGYTDLEGRVGWTVRRYDATSSSWDNWPAALRHPLGSAAPSRAIGVTTDGAGNVYVTGSSNGLVVQRLVAF